MGHTMADLPTSIAYSARQTVRLLGSAPASPIHTVLRSLLMPRLRAMLAAGRLYPQTQNALSFFDLMDVRFVTAFRMRGVKLRTLRAVIDAMMARLATPHPFVRQSAYSFCADGMLFRETLLESAIEKGDQSLSALLSAPSSGYDVIRRELLAGLKFDKETRLIRSWTPRPKRFPGIVIDPQAAGGQPAGQSGVSTARLHAAWKAEKRDVVAVARLYRLDIADVLEAVRFEEALGEKLTVASPGGHECAAS